LALLWATWSAPLLFAQSDNSGTSEGASEAPRATTTGQPAILTANSIGTDDDAIPLVPLPPPPPPTAAVKADVPAPEKAGPPSATAPIGGLVQVGCKNCGGGLLGPPPDEDEPPAGGIDGCPCRPCPAGRQPCHPCLADTCFGRCCCAIYECICCPDPCYEPHWTPIADSAFWVDSARPVAEQRIRWDKGLNLILPDRAEFFWARADGMGKGPPPPAPFKVVPRLNYNELSVYTEVGTGTASFTTEIPYRSIDPAPGTHSSGFADMTIGTKALLYDCELIQIATLFKTYIPSGNFNRGLGTGHVSLEPSLLVGLKLAKDTYVQAQVAEWIPLGGDSNYQGSVLHYHFSLNQVLFRILPDVPLIGTLELNGWAFQDGAFTDPFLGSFQKASAEMYVMPAVGIRLFVCNKIDIGFSAAFAVTDQHFADQIYRTELRWRF
jgi:hypothetical protein